MQRKIQMILPVLLILFIGNFTKQAQNNSNYWVYQLTETETAYGISRTNTLGNSTEQLIIIPKIPAFNLSSILPQDELAIAEQWITGSVSSPVGASIPTFFERPPRTNLVDVVPSPDNSQVALTIMYSLCTTQMNQQCFGVTQVVVIPTIPGPQTILWSLPMNANSPFFPYCDPGFVYTDALSVDTVIGELRWLPNQLGVVAKIYYQTDTVLPDAPLVIIPINAPENAFTVGSGTRGWNIAPSSNEIVSLARDCEIFSWEDTARVATFNLITQNTSYVDYPLGTGIEYFSGNFDTNYLQGQIIFPVVETPLFSEAPLSFRLGNLNTVQAGMTLLTGTISTIEQLQTSASGEVAVIEDKDGLLWQLILNDTAFELFPITTTSVTHWQFANDHELVVQYTGQTQFSIVLIPTDINDLSPLISAIYKEFFRYE